jgi:hypothetical protein
MLYRIILLDYGKSPVFMRGIYTLAFTEGFPLFIKRKIGIIFGLSMKCAVVGYFRRFIEVSIMPCFEV